MKKLFTLFMLLFLFTITATAQTFVPKLEPNDIGSNDIFFFDANTGWIAGFGFISKTTDGGKTWTKIALSSEKMSVGKVQFVSAEKGFAISTKNLLLTSEDGGTNWKETKCAEVKGYIKDLKFINEKKGYIATSKGQVIITEDAGATWKAVQVIPDSLKRKNINSLDAMGNSVVVVGDYADYLYYSKDGGKTWAKGTLEGGLGGYNYMRTTLWNVKFITETNLCATGYGTTVFMSPTILLLSEDGGITWKYQDQKENKVYASARDICFKDDKNGIAVSGDLSGGAIILKTSDGGKNWIPKYLPIGGSVTEVSNVGNNVWAIGYGATLLYSPDFGETWENLNNRGPIAIYTIAALGNEGVFAGGYAGYFAKSTNQGGNWETGYVGTPGHIYRITSAYFLDENIGYVVGNHRSCFKTTDGGKTWESLMEEVLDYRHGNEEVYFLDENNGFVVGESQGQDALYITTDGGKNWTEKDSVYGKSLTSITFSGKKHGIIGGRENILLYTEDSGATWKPAENNGGGESTIQSIYMYDEKNAIAVTSTYLLVTKDGGKNWTSVAVEGKYWNKGVMLSEAEWILLGNKGAIKTNDAGTTWKELELPVDRVAAIGVDKKGFVWIADYNGNIYRTDSKVDIEETNIQPNKFALEQNYPNPFNPSTTIKYSIAKDANVKIVLYDAIGREVEILVNEYKTAGTYELLYSASNLSSGVYFYTLNAGNKIITKKLMLLK